MERDKLLKLSELSKIMLEVKNINEAIHYGADVIKKLMGVERVSIFILDNDKVWTLRADYIEKIEMPKNKGIVGAVIDSKSVYISNDTYNDTNFNPEIDRQTGFITKNILAIPIIDALGRVIGVVEFINKPEDFNEKDVALGKLFAQYTSEPLKFHLGII